MAQVADWINDQGGDWEVGSNWNTGTVPGSLTIAEIDGIDAFAVRVIGSQAAALLTLDDAAATLDVIGALTIGSTLALDAGTLVVTGELAAQTIALEGALELSGTIAGGVITSSGTASQTVIGAGVLLDVTDQGTLSVATGASLLLGGTFFDSVADLLNAGTVTVGSSSGAAAFDNSAGTIIVEAGVAINLGTYGSLISIPSLGQIVSDGGIVNLLATVDLGGGSLDASSLAVGLSVASVADGTLSVDEQDLFLTADNAVVFTNGNTIQLGGTDVTIVTEGSVTSYAALDHATIEGPVTSFISVKDGLTVLAGTAGGAGTIDAPINFVDAVATLDNAVILGSPDLMSSGLLVLGPNLVVLNQASGTLGVESLFAPPAGSFINKGTIDVGASVFDVSALAFANEGSIDARDGTLDVFLAYTTTTTFGVGVYVSSTLANSFRNDGAIDVSSATTLALDAIVDLSSLGSIDGTDATLVIRPAQPSFFSLPVSNAGVAAATLDLGGGTLVLGEGDSFNELDLQGVLANGYLDVEGGGYFFNDGGTLENVVMVTPCFAAGTRITTARGEVAVEALVLGDAVRVRGGGTRAVVWLGRRQVACHRHPQRARVDPVRVSAGAFAPGRPARDLWLSPDHAVHVEGVLVPIKYLVNGCTVVQVSVDTVEYWHVELDRHDVLLAEGLEVESYLDGGNRSAFANAGQVARLHPDFLPDAQAEWAWEADACAPFRADGPVVARAAARLRRRAAALGTRPIRARRPPVVPCVGATTILPDLLRPDWYLAANPDVAASGMAAFTHYATWGHEEGRLPCPEEDLLRGLGLIDPGTVAVTMADVVLAGQDPVRHFCRIGWHERRRPNPYFDTGWYLDTHAVPSGLNPLLHYVLVGEARGLPPSRHFSPAWYRARHALAAGCSPLAHYMRHRRTQSVSPLPSFDVAAYVREAAGSLPPDCDPYMHFRASRDAARDRQVRRAA